MSTRAGNADTGYKKWKGIVTEQNIGQFEAEAAIDADNVEFMPDGTVQRRLGIEKEAEGWALFIRGSAERLNSATSHFLWEDVGGVAGVSIRAIQNGDVVQFYDATYPVGQATLLGTLNLRNYAAGPLSGVGVTACQYAAGIEMLMIAAEGINPVAVRARPGSYPPALVAWAPAIRIRWTRLEGGPITSARGVDTLYSDTEFDLRNSGWPTRADCAADQDGGSARIHKMDPVWYYKYINGVWPVPSVLYSALRLGTAVEAAALGSFSPWEVDKIFFGNTIPPLGHFVTDAWDFNSQTLMLKNGENTNKAGGATGMPVPTSPKLIPLEGITGQVTLLGDNHFTFTSVLSAAIEGSTIQPGSILYGMGVEQALINKTTEGAVRLRWTRGANAANTLYAATGDGRGGFVMAAKTQHPISVGDTFALA